MFGAKKNGIRLAPNAVSSGELAVPPAPTIEAAYSIASYSGRVRNSGYSGERLILSKITAACS